MKLSRLRSLWTLSWLIFRAFDKLEFVSLSSEVSEVLWVEEPALLLQLRVKHDDVWKSQKSDVPKNSNFLRNSTSSSLLMLDFRVKLKPKAWTNGIPVLVAFEDWGDCPMLSCVLFSSADFYEGLFTATLFTFPETRHNVIQRLERPSAALPNSLASRKYFSFFVKD